MTLLLTHDDVDAHVTPPGHPERVARMDAVRRALEDLALDRRTPKVAGDDVAALCHPQAYLDRLAAAVPTEGWTTLDPDTHMAPGSLRAARLAVGAAVAAVDAVVAGEAPNAFVAMRPPGHHAETSTPMGFCLLGTVAIAARHAMAAHGTARVAVVDFDVHHGNGTQDLLWDEDRAFFVSSHQSPLWPGTGAPDETGAHGQVMNRPLPPGSDGAAMRRLYEREVLPALDAYRPELVLVSAGFDAHADDPLAQLRWTEDDFAWLTDRLAEVADRHGGGRLVSCLEGGYDLAALGRSVRAHVQGLVGASHG